MIDASLVCEICLQNFTQHMNKGAKWCQNYLASHRARCRLPYKQIAHQDSEITVYCLPPDAPVPQQTFAFNSVVRTMRDSEEIPAEKAGWYPNMSRQTRQNFQPHLFLPVREGRTYGVATVERRRCYRATYDRGQWKVEDPSGDAVPCWTIGRIWTYEPYRRRGIAKSTIHAVCHHFNIDVSQLGWMLPLSASGTYLSGVLIKGPQYVTAG